jgi:hypothetical protein
VVDVEMKGPLLAGAAAATAKQGRRDAGLVQHAHGQPSAPIEALQHLPFLVVLQTACWEAATHTSQTPRSQLPIRLKRGVNLFDR